MRQWISVILVMFAIGVAMGYTFNELNKFNSIVNQVLAP